MNRSPWLAGLLSMLFPGTGQIYAGKKALGAAFMLAFVMIGNMNVIWLSLYSGAQTDMRFFGNILPRLLHDMFAFYGIVFWLWQAFDAYRLTKNQQAIVKY